MSIRIGSNTLALGAIRQLNKTSDEMNRVAERLASGQRINRASDDAAGLAIASSLKNDAGVFGIAVRNISDGISAIAITEGALTSLSGILTRQAELAEQAANGSYSTEQRKALNTEANALVSEYNRIVESTSFNGMKLLENPSQSYRVQAGYGVDGSIQFSMGNEMARAIGNLTFTPVSASVNPQVLRSPLEMADVNNDGHLDVLFGSGSGFTYTLLGDGAGNWSHMNTEQTGGAGNTNSIAIADFDEDGYADYITTHVGDVIAFYEGVGNGTFNTIQSYAVAGTVGSIEAGDSDNDGHADYVLSSTGQLQFFKGLGNGTFQSAVTTTLASLGGATDIDAADFNGDGIADFVTTNLNAGTQGIFIGNGNGTFAVKTATVTSALGDAESTIGDFNGDGLDDFAVAVRNSTSVSVLLSNGDGSFSRRDYAVEDSTSDTYRGIASGDLNGDGIDDLAVTDFDTPTIQLLLGNSDGTFRAATSMSLAGSQARSVGIADVTGDGVADIINGGNGIRTFRSGTIESNLLPRLNLYTAEYAREALDFINQRINAVAQEMGNLGSTVSRFQVAANTLRIARENYLNAHSRIASNDVAEDVAHYTNKRILQQMGAGILAQANLSPSVALALLTE